MPIAAVAKEYGRLMDLYYDVPSHRNWWQNDDRELAKHQDSLINGIEEIWLEYPDERVAFETKLKLGVKICT